MSETLYIKDIERMIDKIVSDMLNLGYIVCDCVEYIGIGDNGMEMKIIKDRGEGLLDGIHI